MRNFLGTSLSAILMFSVFGCTHTATFDKPVEATKDLLPATSRNLESFLLEKELSFARTSEAACGVLSVLSGLAGLNSLSERAVSGAGSRSEALGYFALAGGSLICATYSGFIADRAAVYLNAAGVRIEL